MFYRHKVLNDHVIRIIDKLNVCMYLVIGSERACLIDTGYGYKGLRAYVESLTDKPLFILLSHGHIDHAFGIYEFEDADIYIHEEDLQTYKVHSDLEYRDRFLKSHGAALNDDFQKEREMVFKTIENGQVFDLGDFHIQAVHVPGHTKGMMMFLLEEERIMLFGDACGANTMIMEDCSGNLSDYLRSLRDLKKMDGLYDMIYRNHGTFVSEKSLLDNVIEAVEKVLDHTDDRMLLPESMQKMFPHDPGKELLSYCAVSSDMAAGGIRYDGKEGNVLYRADKAV